jgi:hypothetical protein
MRSIRRNRRVTPPSSVTGRRCYKCAHYLVSFQQLGFRRGDLLDPRKKSENTHFGSPFSNICWKVLASRSGLAPTVPGRHRSGGLWGAYKPFTGPCAKSISTCDVRENDWPHLCSAAIVPANAPVATCFLGRWSRLFGPMAISGHFRVERLFRSKPSAGVQQPFLVHFCDSFYALIAAISGPTPMMFMRRVRL